jgi:putative endonuclease
MYTVYALYSKSYQKIYIGYTSDIEERLIAHNHPKNYGWTAKFMPWILVYSECYIKKTDAMKREKELKSYKGREFIWSQVKMNLEENI